MFQIPMDVFAYTNEPALLARGARPVYANAAARQLLGEDWESKSLSALLGADIAGTQASNFMAEVTIGGKPLTVRVTKQEGGQLFLFSRPETQPNVLNDAFIYALRSNLMTMNVALEICRGKAESRGDDDMLQNLQEMNRAHFRLSRMVSNIAVLRSAMDQTLCFNPVSIDAGLLCRECVDCISSLLPEIAFSLNIKAGIYITADASLIQKLLINLISNCVVHAVGLRRISIGLMESGESVILSVSDDGCGIPGDMLHQVFNRYSHSYDAAAMNSGAGLGLSIVRLIAQRHGGTLLLESRPGHGTTVRVSLKKSHSTPIYLHSAETPEHFDINTALIELSDCLDSKFYGEKFMD